MFCLQGWWRVDSLWLWVRFFFLLFSDFQVQSLLFKVTVLLGSSFFFFCYWWLRYFACLEIGVLVSVFWGSKGSFVLVSSCLVDWTCLMYAAITYKDCSNICFCFPKLKQSIFLLYLDFQWFSRHCIMYIVRLSPWTWQILQCLFQEFRVFCDFVFEFHIHWMSVEKPRSAVSLPLGNKFFYQPKSIFSFEYGSSWFQYW